MAILQVEDIQKRFGRTRVLEDISFSLEQGQAMAIIGSSGSGKTTLLRCLNFLEQPDRGRITVGGEVLFDADDPATQRESEVRKKRLHFGLVFQSFNLFPQYTALENVTLAGQLLARERPDFKGEKKRIFAEIEEKGRTLLAQMGLADRAGHYPHQLSGGQPRVKPPPPPPPAAGSSGWPSPGPWPSAPISSALTSPPPPWTRSSPARCCG